MINFYEIKTELIETGLAHAQDVVNAEQTIIGVYGRWNRDGSAHITRTCAGWIVGSFPKTINIQFAVPETSNFNKAVIESHFQTLYPDSKIIVSII